MSENTCNNECIHEMLNREDFYNNPRDAFINIVDALPAPEEAWMLAFGLVFLSSVLDDQLQRSCHANLELARVCPFAPTSCAADA